MSKKQNAFIAQLRAQAQEKEAIKSQMHVEIDTIAMILAANSALQVGPGRSGKLMNDFLAWKMDIADAIVKELDEDQSKQKELIVVKRDLATRVKAVLGPDNWEKYKTLLPLLSEYW